MALEEEIGYIPNYDENVLSELGFDVHDYAGSGGYGTVLKGMCNSRAVRYAIPLDVEQWHDTTHYRANVVNDATARVVLVLDGKPCAIKRVSLDPFNYDTATNEAAILAQLRHPNVVFMYDVVICRGEELYIIMELCSKEGSLHQFINNCWYTHQNVCERSMRFMIEWLASGLRYIHRMRVYHGDITTHNIMFFLGDNGYRLRYVDFGISRIFDAQQATDQQYKQTDLQALAIVLEKIMEVTNFDSEDSKLAFYWFRMLFTVSDDIDEATAYIPQFQH